EVISRLKRTSEVPGAPGGEDEQKVGTGPAGQGSDHMGSPSPLEQAAEVQPAPMLFDVRAGLKITEGDADLLGELARLFLDDSPKIMAQISDGMASRDLEGVRRAAHRLKGSLATFGAHKVSRTAGQLEKAGQVAGPEHLAAAWKVLQAEMKGLQEELLDLIGGESSICRS
ncbi:MAG: Hpt domain-containing protein, partial [Acidobacteriota bacterium]